MDKIEEILSAFYNDPLTMTASGTAKQIRQQIGLELSKVLDSYNDRCMFNKHELSMIIREVCQLEE